MNILFAHHLDKYFKGSLREFGLEYEEYLSYIEDYLKNVPKGSEIDKVIITKFEDPKLEPEEIDMLERLGLDYEVIEYGYGWWRNSELFEQYESFETAVKNEEGEPLMVYRGGEINEGINFFSESVEFTRDYSNCTNSYFIKVEKLFDCFNKEHIELLMESLGGGIEDPFEDSTFDNYENFIESVSSDTWSALENHLNDIQDLGFDGVKMTEGGRVNYITLNSSQVLSAIDFEEELREKYRGEKWIQGKRAHHGEEDILLITEEIEGVIEQLQRANSVKLIGAFEGECINDIEAVFENCDISHYEREDGLIIGSDIKYEPSKSFYITKSIEQAYLSFKSCMIENPDETYELILMMDRLDLENIYENLKRSILNLNISGLKIEDLELDIKDMVFLDFLEEVEESKNFQELIDRYNKENTFNLSGKYYHGTAMDRKELEDLEMLETGYSDLEAVYVCNVADDVRFFSENRTEEMKVVIEVDLDIDNLFLIPSEGREYFYLNGVHYNIAGDREEYFDVLRDLGYSGVVVENNYPLGGHDIALFEDIDLGDAQIALIQKNEGLSFKNKEELLRFSLGNKKVRGRKIA